MPTLDFKGKNHIYAHHLTVPYRPLQLDESRSVLPAPTPNPSPIKREGLTDSTDIPLTDQNLIIHGDNLHALKALLPHYAGRVKCIYIDPPYNTGNEGWVYNDKVNSPLMREWFEKNSPVDGEDLERHDKWLCMMWPRLHLLRELLRDDGVIFISIDDNEHHHLRMLMDEIFGEENFLASFLWRKKGTSTNVSGASVSANADYQLCYRKSVLGTIKQRITSRDTRQYQFNDHIGDYRTQVIEKRNDAGYARSTMRFKILGQYPREGRRWQIGEDTARELEKRNRFTISERGIVQRKIYDFEDRDTRSANPTYLPDECGSSNSANKTLTGILGNSNFENPKPPELISHLIGVASDNNDIILDSFAGSGTTAHAVLALNKEDGGNRRFILVECEDYADSITAERVRRVIRGIPASKNKSVQLGTGGSFAYCTLGDPIEVDSLLIGERLPAFGQLASYLLHTASGISVQPDSLPVDNRDGFFYFTDERDYYLIYQPCVEFLRGGEAALNLERAERIREKGRPALVFAAAKYISQKVLTGWNITFCQLPYELDSGG